MNVGSMNGQSRFEATEWQCLLRFRLELALSAPKSKCGACSQKMNVFGDHALTGPGLACTAGTTVCGTMRGG